MDAFFYTSNLSRDFGGVRAVNQVNLHLRENEIRSLIGPNGAGKTTLVNVITGRIFASSGKVIYKGEEITNKPVHTVVKKGISRTFQISSVFPTLSVFENVRIAKQAYLGGSRRILSSKGSLKRVDDETWGILEELGLKESAYAQAKNLAYGDIRILELAIALSRKPHILFLDEPTAGMSSGETKRTTELIRQLAEDVTVVIIEHDMDVVMSISDKISVLDQGSIIAEGSPQEIRDNPKVKEAYLGEQA